MELGDGQCDCEMGEILPSGSSSIAQELRRLEKEKESLEVRISSLRMQLEAGNPSNAAQIDERSTKEGEIPNPEACVRGLTPQMVHRYSRHLLLPSFGVRGQRNLSKASILVVGAGGLGSPIIMYLAACGVGTATLYL